jgi:flagellar biosynthetic protein FlhB
MSDEADKESKTEQATEKKTRDAIEKGNVPFSREASVFASLLGIFIVTSFFLVSNVTRMSVSLERFIDDPGGWSLENSSDAVGLFSAIGLDAAHLIVPVVVILGMAGIAASFFQNPPSLVFTRIEPDLSRISIKKGWSRIFGIQGLVEFLKATFKFGAVGLIGFLLIEYFQIDIFNAMFVEPVTLPQLILTMVNRLLAAVVMATLLLVAADIVWSRIHWRRELRMTRQEVKDEHKQIDGDPIVKARMRSLARDRSRKRMIAAVPRATMVIANPTHFAVALRYVREEGGAPLVIAKGQDLIALKIRQVAEENGIPVIEDKLLARSLYQSVEVDKLIPPEFYKAVAQIVFFLTNQNSGGTAKRLP